MGKRIMQLFGYTSKDVLSKYMELPQGGSVQATYIWIDGTGQGLRSKTKTLESKPTKVADPFRRGDNVLVLCEAYTHDKAPMESNKRKACLEVMEKAKEFAPWFGIEQEYTLLDQDQPRVFIWGMISGWR